MDIGIETHTHMLLHIHRNIREGSEWITPGCHYWDYIGDRTGRFEKKGNWWGGRYKKDYSKMGKCS